MFASLKTNLKLIRMIWFWWQARRAVLALMEAQAALDACRGAPPADTIAAARRLCLWALDRVKGIPDGLDPDIDAAKAIAATAIESIDAAVADQARKS